MIIGTALGALSSVVGVLIVGDLRGMAVAIIAYACGFIAVARMS